LIDKFFSENKAVLLVFGYNVTQERPSLDCREFAVNAYGGIYEKPLLRIETQSGFGSLKMSMELPNIFQGAVITNQVQKN
jgi:hypothetical protein